MGGVFSLDALDLAGHQSPVFVGPEVGAGQQLYPHPLLIGRVRVRVRGKGGGCWNYPTRWCGVPSYRGKNASSPQRPLALLLVTSLLIFRRSCDW